MFHVQQLPVKYIGSAPASCKGKNRTEGAAGAVAPSGRVDKGSWVSTSCPDCLGVQCWTALWILRFHESFVGGSRTPGRTCCTTVQWTAWWTTSEKSPNPSVGLKSPGSHPASFWYPQCDWMSARCVASHWSLDSATHPAEIHSTRALVIKEHMSRIWL